MMLRDTNIKIDVEDADDVAGVLLNNGILTLGKEGCKPVWSMKPPIKGCKDERRFVKIAKILLFPEESEGLDG